MKLELKYLVPYLPYKLKGRVDKKTYNQPKKERIGELKTIDLSDNNYELAVYTELGYFLCNVNDFKPILRPLSDLTKKEYRCLFIGNPLDYKIDELPYKVFAKLLELHFDVFHLIPQGLAIDINTL